MHRVLIVDDEPKLGRLLASSLQATATCDVVQRGEDALARLAAETYAVVVTDLRMPGMDGMQLLREIRQRSRSARVVLMTAYARAQDAVEAMKLGAEDYLVKPFDIDEFRHKIGALLPPDPSRSPGNLAGLVGRSAAMREVSDLVQKVAARDATVLVRGEIGTGRGTVARALHDLSARARGPFVSVSCAAGSESQLEAELFGHVSPAGHTPGAFERAQGGTLFLDEVGELPAGTQGKLLRVLQDRRYAPLGGHDQREPDVRLVCSTSRDLSQDVVLGRFRPELFYRLNVFPIRLPPVRDREGDRRLLVEHFLVQAGRSPASITREALERLDSYAWPGNVREIANAIERALILAGEDDIAVRHLPPELSTRAPSTTGPSTEPPSLDELELRTIENALQKAGGNKSRAAELLGITRRRLYSRIGSLSRKVPR